MGTASPYHRFSFAPFLHLAISFLRHFYTPGVLINGTGYSWPMHKEVVDEMR
jgi:hypothetical protein